MRNGSEISEYGKGLYSSEMYAQRAEEIIRESRLGSPYFLYLSFTMVHAPFQESKWQVAVRRGDFKLVLGSVGMIKRDGSAKNSLKTRVRKLYNLAKDPNERHNLPLRKWNDF